MARSWTTSDGWVPPYETSEAASRGQCDRASLMVFCPTNPGKILCRWEEVDILDERPATLQTGSIFWWQAMYPDIMTSTEDSW